ncbi:MAG TPA: cell division protein FtsQ/DivIB [Conexibacter sp.]|jgi:cell division protein FtsQ
MGPSSSPSARAPFGLARVLRLRRLGAARRGVARLRPRRPRLRTAIFAILLVVVLGFGWHWLRDSPLVTVKHVTVTGISGSQADRVTQALDDAARKMTTLDVDRAALESAVAPYSIVKGIEVSTDFPTGMKVHVISNVAVAAVELDGRRTPVTEDGTLLRDVAPAAALPTVPLHGTPDGSSVAEGEALRALAALGAAPDSLRSRIGQVSVTRDHGLELQISSGPVLWFGDNDELNAKWAAAAAVLADPQAAGASYVDVAAPERPAVGGLPDGAPTTSTSDIPSLTDPADPAATTDAGTPDPTADSTP